MLRQILTILSLFIIAQSTAQINKAGLPVDGDIIVYPLDMLNSEFRDVNISITPNGKYLYYMSGRGGKPWSSARPSVYKGKSEYDGDIWFSKKQGDQWQAPQSLSNAINTSKGEDEPNISVDAQRVYFQSWKTDWEKTGGPYYKAELYGEKWENPEGMGGGIAQFFRDEYRKYFRYATDGMSVSPDGNIFVVAAGPDYDGNLDIYISRKDEKGIWSYPKMLPISTKQDERSVFIAGDNTTLYFGTDGRGGFGGLDIFKTTINDDDTCGEIINIGKPFNTKQDDYGFIIGALGNDAFFVRESDIYYANLTGTAESIKPQPTVLIDGIVKNTSGTPLQADINLYRDGHNPPISSARSNATTGEYALAFPKIPGAYTQIVSIEKLDPIEESFEINDSTQLQLNFNIVAPDFPTTTKEKVVETPPVVQKELVAKSFVQVPLVETVHFDFDKDLLNPSEIQKLEQLFSKVNEADQCQITIVGHTDSDGSDQYNVNLSERRAKKVQQWIQTQQISHPVQLDFQGEKVPKLENDSPENRAINRRVEITITF